MHIKHDGGFLRVSECSGGSMASNVGTGEQGHASAPESIPQTNAVQTRGPKSTKPECKIQVEATIHGGSTAGTGVAAVLAPDVT